MLRLYTLLPRTQIQCPPLTPLVLLVSSHVLVIVGYGLLLCILPVRGLKLGIVLVLHSTVPAFPCVVLVLSALFVPIALLTLFWWVPLVPSLKP